MASSKQIAGLLGPVLVVVPISEFPLVQPDLYAEQIPPVVYLSGLLMFIGGLAIVRAHSVWVRNWTVLITLIGWGLLLVGLIRMFAATQYPQTYANTSPLIFMVLEACLVVVGLILTYKAYFGRKD